MHTIILTGADHCYANALLGILIRRGVFTGHTLLILEQHGLIPGKTKIDGLLRYLRISGIRYVGWQIAKQLLFQLTRCLCGLLGRTQSLYYPFWRLGHPSLVRKPCPLLTSNEADSLIKKFRPDTILSVYSKYIIPKRIFSLPRLGCVNLHPAPLPYYRGISPTFWMLSRGEKTAGVTLHEVDEGIDTGRIVGKKTFSTSGFTSEHGLYMEATRRGVTLIEDFLNGKNVRRQPNPKEGSYFRLPTKDAVNDFLSRGYRFFTHTEFIRL